MRIALSLSLLILSACGQPAPVENQPLVIVENQPPIITILVTPTSGSAPLTVNLDMSVSDPDGSIAKTECDFKGDGTYILFGYSGLLQYTYNTPGTYNLVCRTTDNNEAVTSSQMQTILVTTAPGTIIKTLPYPAGITGISDVVYDSSSQSLFLFIYDVLNNWKVTKIIQVNPLSGETLSTTDITNPDFFINHASEFTKAGDYYYGTSSGWSNGTPQSLIYKIDINGNIISSFPCPATNTGGFCEGLAWDGTYLWTGASDNKDIVQFSTDGTIQKTITLFNTIGIGDISYNNGKVIVSKDNYIYQVDPQSSTTSNEFYIGSFKTGDWDGQLFWFINNSTQQLEGIYTGF